MQKNILVFGSSLMAEEYLKVIKGLEHNAIIIGRNPEKAKELAEKYNFTGFGDSTNSLDKIDCNKIDLVIVASAIESLKEITIECMKKGLNNILIEKPGALNLKELQEIEGQQEEQNLRIAHNRRFHNSVILLKKHIEIDGGPTGCFFDFTEREKDLVNSKKDKEVIERWGFANSTHVIDTAFHLIGLPTEISTDQGSSWNIHPSGITFVGHGKSDKCLFSYFASWRSGGRWNVEISTLKGRYKLSPLETLQFCEKDQFNWIDLEIENKDDEDYKPGLLKMVKSMLEKNEEIQNLPSIKEEIETCKAINKIFGYNDG